jgi:hypothetical protein
MMLLPLFAFFAALVFLGGIASLAVAVDKHASRKAPLPFAAFFAGLGFWIVLIVSGVLFGALNMKGLISEPLAFVVPILAATFVGGIGGGVYGCRLGEARRSKYAHLNT